MDVESLLRTPVVVATDENGKAGEGYIAPDIAGIRSVTETPSGQDVPVGSSRPAIVPDVVASFAQPDAQTPNIIVNHGRRLRARRVILLSRRRRALAGHHRRRRETTSLYRQVRARTALAHRLEASNARVSAQIAYYRGLVEGGGHS